MNIKEDSELSCEWKDTNASFSAVSSASPLAFVIAAATGRMSGKFTQCTTVLNTTDSKRG
jgi:hypothetical protein